MTSREKILNALNHQYSKYIGFSAVVLFLTATGMHAQDVGTADATDQAILSRKKNRAHYKEEAEKLVKEMTLDEKVSLICMSSAPVGRLGIPKHDWWNEALSGVGRNGIATQFPQSISMASTWNPELIQRMTTAISDEARAKHHAQPNRNNRYQGLTIWSPTVNMARDPRWGRNEETYGEDPWLTSRIGNAFVKGLQGDNPKYLKTVATVKHFIANNTEYNRTRTRPFIPEEFLRDYYMIPFKSAVEEADVQSIMTAYNGINDVPCTMNKWLITDVLRGEWGFSGTVVTDVRAPQFLRKDHKVTASDVEGAEKMLQAGVDVISDKNDFRGHVMEAINQKLISEKDLDRAIIQNLSTRMELGQIIDDQDNPFTKIPMAVVGSDAHRAIAREISQQGTVLLKNESGLLPIDTEKIKRVVVAGPYGNLAQLGGYSGSPTIKPITPLVGIRNAALEMGIDVVDMTTTEDFEVISASNLRPAEGVEGGSGLKGEYFAGTRLEGKPSATRLDPSVSFNWPKPIENIDPDIPQPEFSVRWTGQLVPDRTGEFRLAVGSDDGVRVWLDDQLIIEDWTARAVKRNASEPLRLTAGQSYDLRVEYFDAGGEAVVHLLWKRPLKEKVIIYDKDSTLAVFVCGFNIHMADEFKDLMNLNLPKEQLTELKKLYETYPNTVVVLNGGTIVASEWLYENVPAILHAWYAGQEGGDALADLLFGTVSPSGRSPVTFYASADALPNIDDYDLSHGRTYMYTEQKVNFPFGHGLTYTTFEYGDVSLSQNVVQADAPSVTVSVPVKNAGKMAADEVVQVYVKDLSADNRVYTPQKQLFGFQRISLKPGEEKAAQISLDARAFSFWNAKKAAYVIEPGDFEIQIGASSADIRGKAILTIQ